MKRYIFFIALTVAGFTVQTAFSQNTNQKNQGTSPGQNPNEQRQNRDPNQNQNQNSYQNQYRDNQNNVNERDRQNQTPGQGQNPPPQNPTNTYRYSDANGNVYIISPGSFEYKPAQVTSANSGQQYGAAVKRTITQEQYQSVAAMMDKATADKNGHIKTYEKGSGTIYVTNDGQETAYIFPSGSTYMTDLDASLKKMRE